MTAASGFGPRGGDVDGNGVSLGILASGHLASFDRRKCRSISGPSATATSAPKDGHSFSSRAAVEGCDRSGQRRGELLHVIDDSVSSASAGMCLSRWKI